MTSDPRPSVPLPRSERDEPLIVEYVAPPSGIFEALEGWAVEVHDKDGVVSSGVFEGFTPKDGTEGMFRLCEVLEPSEVVYATHIDNVRKFVVL